MCWELIAIFNFLKIRMRVDTFGTAKCKVTFDLEYIYNIQSNKLPVKEDLCRSKLSCRHDSKKQTHDPRLAVAGISGPEDIKRVFTLLSLSEHGNLTAHSQNQWKFQGGFFKQSNPVI